MGEEEEVNVWCDPFDPCGYLVFMMAIYGSMIIIIMDLAKLVKKHDRMTTMRLRMRMHSRSRRILGQGQAVNIEIRRSKFLTPVGNE